jgi:uncharacterized protein (DUF779 family)
MDPKIVATEKAKSLINDLKEIHGPLMFHLSGGCCDGSSPQCYPKGELFLDDTDEELGEVQGCGFYMAKDQYAFFKDSLLTLDTVPGRGSSFSLEIPTGHRFIIKSEICKVS